MKIEAVDRRLEGKTILEQTRLAELYLLDVFVEICNEHNLRYFLTYGTLIGAMRHNGFIPWDDDIDIGMPLDDYNRFLRIAPSVLPENLLIDHSSVISGTAGCYMKIRDRSSFFCENNTDVTLPCGFFLDIFPFEKLPALPHRFNQALSTWCALAAWSYRAYLRMRHKNILSICKSAMMAMVWGGIHKVLRGVFCVLKMLGNNKWRNAPENGPEQMDGVSDAELFPLKKHIFEGNEYCVPNNADLFLTQQFGNWRKLPPEKDRVWHADIVCPTTPPRAWWAMPYKSNAEKSGGEVS